MENHTQLVIESGEASERRAIGSQPAGQLSGQLDKQVAQMAPPQPDGDGAGRLWPIGAQAVSRKSVANSMTTTTTTIWATQWPPIKRVALRATPFGRRPQSGGAGAANWAGPGRPECWKAMRAAPRDELANELSSGQRVARQGNKNNVPLGQCHLAAVGLRADWPP